MTFDVTIDDSNDLLVEDYMEHKSESLADVAQESTIDMISDIYYLSAKCVKLMEEYRKNPDDVCSHAELMRHYGLA